MKNVKLFMNGEFVESSTEKYTDAYNPSTGEVIAKVPCCTEWRFFTRCVICCISI